MNLATTWRARYNVQSVVLVQLIPRLTPRHILSIDYFTRTLEVSKKLKDECRHCDILCRKIFGVKYPPIHIFSVMVYILMMAECFVTTIVNVVQ